MKRAVCLAVLFLLPAIAADEPQSVLLEMASPAGGAELRDLFSVAGSVALETSESPPVALLMATPAYGAAPLDVQFTMRAKGPEIASWQLDIGDDGSNEATGTQDLSKVIQTYEATFTDGEYPVRLTVFAANGKSDSETLVVSSGGFSMMSGPAGHWASDDENDEIPILPPAAGEPVAAVVPNHDVAWGDIRDELPGSIKVTMGLYDYNPDIFSPIDPIIGGVGYATIYGVQFCLDNYDNPATAAGTFCYRVSSQVDVLGLLSESQVSTNDGSGLCGHDFLIDSGFDESTGEFWWTLDRNAMNIRATGATLNDCVDLQSGPSGAVDGTTMSEFFAFSSAKVAVLASLSLQMDVSNPAPDYEFGNTQPPINLPPMVDLSAAPISGLAPLTVDFTMVVNDPENDPVTWTLDADGDDVPETSGSSNVASEQFTFTNPGTYLAKLAASDDQGNDAFDLVTIVVTEEGEEPPTGPGGDLSGTLSVRDNSCVGDEVATFPLDPSDSGRIDFQFVMDAQALPGGFNRLAFCFEGDGFVPTSIVRDVKVVHSNRAPPAPAPKQPDPIQIVSFGASDRFVKETQTIRVDVKVNSAGPVEVLLMQDDAIVAGLDQSMAVGTHTILFDHQFEDAGTYTLSATATQGDQVSRAATKVQAHDLPAAAQILGASAVQTKNGWLVTATVQNQGGTGTVNLGAEVGKTIATTSVWMPAGSQQDVVLQIPALVPGTEVEIQSGQSGLKIKLKATPETPEPLPTNSVTPHRVRGIQLTLDGLDVRGHVVQDGAPDAPLQVEMRIGDSVTLLPVDAFGDFTATLPEGTTDAVFAVDSVMKSITLTGEAKESPVGLPVMVLLGALLYARRK